MGIVAVLIGRPCGQHLAANQQFYRNGLHMARYKFPANKTATTSRTQRNAPRIDPYKTVLESSYPRILETIQVMWGFEEMNGFFRKLSLDDRGGRQGFPPEAWDEIQTLMSLHLIIHPEKNPF